MQIIQPEGWAQPKGYSNGILAQGQTLYVGGQIGWDENEQFQSDDFVDQVRQTLLNTVAILEAGGARPEHITRMTWYITDKQEYLSRLKEVGAVYREVIGRNFPVMAMVQVVALMEDRAKVEIETTAVIP
ncbi:RidA family protein [Pseudomaricurvus alkylphenolicus]|jgi:enamine deaminase RidA (YjgF/YER057c/UK114 family)|uniref:RidA family protein n=1 Tax=Pseudomaricurvus alkylphenolicus TaxID=1306991 RepID=UPI00141FE4A6|nr:RidA family protein [Pseudomaricurvus alkylphenolicus]NIB40425.1 RidA family protein [Pseudomaricurvus alkylphenolicus]